jgi:hypothetical protein
MKKPFQRGGTQDLDLYWGKRSLHPSPCSMSSIRRDVKKRLGFDRESRLFLDLGIDFVERRYALPIICELWTSAKPAFYDTARLD